MLTSKTRAGFLEKRQLNSARLRPIFETFNMLRVRTGRKEVSRPMHSAQTDWGGAVEAGGAKHNYHLQQRRGREAGLADGISSPE